MTASSPDVMVDARLEAVRILPATTAVIVVDMQNDFATPGGMFDQAGIDIGAIRQTIRPTASLLDRTR